MRTKIQREKMIETFSNLTFFPMTVPNTGCIAEGKLLSGCDITITGGNVNQQADGFNTFLVEVVDARGKGEPRTITKRNMSKDDLSFLIEHHRRNKFRRGRYSKR